MTNGDHPKQPKATPKPAASGSKKPTKPPVSNPKS